ncbi:MAG: hypothetical protein DBX90_15905 [Lentisphaerae bacterium]|nr:MAG: hypothetical protein DBX90_15905 [Lentisphaerota bacterium]
MTRAEFFQRQLGALLKDLPAGTRLPPVRTLLKEYHISLTTFNKAVKHFKDAGRLRAIHGSGIYVDKLPEKIGGEPVEVVNILFFGYRSSLTSEGFIRSLSNLLGLQLSLAGMSATFTLFPPEASLETVKQKLKKMRPQAVITINMYNPGITQYLRSRGIPYICITPAHPADQEYSLYLDDASIMKQILDYLTKLGHRHICYIHGVSTKWYLALGTYPGTGILPVLHHAQHRTEPESGSFRQLFTGGKRCGNPGNPESGLQVYCRNRG